MRRSLTLLTWMVFLTVLGCADQHAKNKQAALERWQTSRAQITTNMAQQQFEGGDLKKAVTTVHDAISINPDYAPAHLLLGRIYLEQDKLTQARDCFNQTLELDPGHAQANYFLGILYERWSKPDKAYEYYRLAWETDHGNLPYLLAMVEAKAAQDEYQQALSLLLEHVAEAEHNTSIYITAGNILTHQEQHEEAVKMYRQAYQINPDNQAVKESWLTPSTAPKITAKKLWPCSRNLPIKTRINYAQRPGCIIWPWAIVTCSWDNITRPSAVSNRSPNRTA